MTTTRDGGGCNDFPVHKVWGLLCRTKAQPNQTHTGESLSLVKYKTTAKVWLTFPEVKKTVCENSHFVHLVSSDSSDSSDSSSPVNITREPQRNYGRYTHQNAPLLSSNVLSKLQHQANNDVRVTATNRQGGRSLYKDPSRSTM